MGGRVRVKVVKNKVAAPFKQTEFDLMYNEGISSEGEIIALGEKMGIIGKIRLVVQIRRPSARPRLRCHETIFER